MKYFMYRNNWGKNNGGFSLIEVLIGMVFLAIGLLAIAGLQITSVRGNFLSNNLMQATYVAQDRLEFLKNKPYDSVELDAVNNKDDIKVPPISGVVYNGRYTIINNVSGYKEITYTVTWNDGTNHSISFSTIRSQ
jgi:type IV pilus assembly protein PilV